MKREISGTVEALTAKNDQFHLEIREAIARLETQKKSAAASTLHGVTFEERLGHLLAFEAHRLNDVHEPTGSSVGVINHCKIGDFVTQLGTDSAAPGARIAWEAKSNKAYDVPAALGELEQARKNRRAQIGIFVLAKASAPEHMDPFQRHGNNLIVVWDADDPGTTAPSVLGTPIGAELLRGPLRESLAHEVGERLNAATLDKVQRNAASSWKQSGHLEGRTFKHRRMVQAKPESVALALYLAHAAGFALADCPGPAWVKVLDCDVSNAMQLAVEAKRLNLIDLRISGTVVDLNLDRLDPAYVRR